MKKNIEILDSNDLIDPKFWQKNHNWIWNQAAAVLARIPPVMNEDRSYNAVLTLKSIAVHPLAFKIFQVFTTSPRTRFLKNNALVSHFNQSVPLVLSVYKRYYNVDYHSWDDNVRVLLEMDHRLVYNNRATVLPDPTTLDWKMLSGKDYSSYCSLGSWSSDVIGRLDRLSKHIYLQTWLWHHSKINKYSIQSLQNWDHRTTTLHTSDIF